ncbi:MAG TPA: hypothetical protein VK961_18495 [Chthoniobacter sp.]|nr:hypothetical protein [Chthoniobacter sp.]
MFVDILGGQPLPPITQMVLENRMLWIGLGCALASASLSMAWIYRFRSVPTLFSVGLLLLAAAQVGLIIFAMLLPLSGTIIRQKS